MRPIAPALGSYAFVTRLAMALLTIAVLSIAMPSMARLPMSMPTMVMLSIAMTILPWRRDRRAESCCCDAAAAPPAAAAALPPSRAAAAAVAPGAAAATRLLSVSHAEAVGHRDPSVHRRSLHLCSRVEGGSEALARLACPSRRLARLAGD